jgi:ATP-binding cassette subfamily B protein
LLREPHHTEKKIPSTGHEEIPSIEGFSASRFLFPFVVPHKGRGLLALLSLILAAASTLSLGWALRAIIDNGLSGNEQQLLTHLAFIAVGVGLLALASFGRSYLVTWIGEAVITRLRMNIFRKLMELDVGFFETRNAGEFISRMNADTTLVQVLVGTSLGIAIRNILLVIGGLIMMCQTSLKLTLMTLCIIPFVIIPIIFYGKKVKKLSMETQDALASMGTISDEMIHHIRLCQSFTHEEKALKEFNKAAKTFFDLSIQRTFARSTLAAIVIMIVFSAVGLVFYQGGLAIISNDMSTGNLSAFLFYAVVVAGSMGSFSEISNDFQRASGALKRIYDILHTKSMIVVASSPKSLSQKPKGMLALHNVLFAYPSDDQRSILKDFTLSLIPGEKVALVGPSGAGKTTVFNLILRFYDPQAGCIYLDGMNTKQLDTHTLRHHIGLVPQDVGLFSTTLLENIRFARPEASLEEVKASAKAACLEEFIESLPKKWHTMVGQNGIRLSGGQRQRVAIARALLKNPSLLLLDEATNSLDAESEQYIQKSLASLTKGRTTLIIAHRLSTVLSADRIVVMDKGRIVEIGTHGELISKNGLYKRLAMIQFQSKV